MLEINTIAPEFSLSDHTGTVRTLSEFAGKTVLLYFYPKDDTPGCTREACMIRDVYNDFETKGIVVLGVSKDSPESHTKFRAKYELPFTLLSDPTGDMISAYGARNALGGTSRVSYLINGEGIITAVFPKVDPASHAIEVLELVK